MPASPKSRKVIKAYKTPRNAYSDFRDLFFEALGNDDSFKANYLAEELESKLLDPEHSLSEGERRTAAIDKWLKCEVRNMDTSMRLLHADGEEDILFLQDGVFPVGCDEVLNLAEFYIRQTIGSTVPWDELKGSFSGGASTKVRRGPGAIARKYQQGSNITEAAIWPFLRLTRSDVWAPRDFDIVEGNEMFTVPKNSLIDRCAAKEPEYNMYVQKAIGDFIRRKLKRVGIDLNDQTRNQRLAKEGSIKGNLATIDLSSASDSITRQLVLRLVPDEWFHMMDAVRSPTTKIGNTIHDNVMFSSMGNGYTFELESLIFWALTRAVCRILRIPGSISVYGDDIICPSEACEALVSTLDFCGFQVNTKKSFWSGGFRESCGTHWFEGRDVTPFYVKKVPEDVTDWCLLLNSLRKWCHEVAGICNPEYFALWDLFAKELIPRPLWGGWDLSVRHNLVSGGRLPIARMYRITVRAFDDEIKYSLGAYLHWLSASEDRESPSELVTSEFTSDGQLLMRKTAKPSITRNVPLFPQEIEGAEDA